MDKCCKACDKIKPIDEFYIGRLCKLCKNKKNLEHYYQNREHRLEVGKLYVKNNPTKNYAKQLAWCQRHPEKANARNAKRRAVKLSRIPSWSESFIVDEIYHLAKIRTEITGVKWHVDHVVPLNSPLVSGLHCEANLRVIPAQQNYDKGNRHWPDMW